MKISTIYNKAKGFTLIELLVVIAILATLAGVGYPLVMSQMGKAKVSQAKDACVKLVSGVENFMVDNNGDFPFEIGGSRLSSRSNGGVMEIGKENYFITTADGKDGGMIRVLVNQEEESGNRALNRAGQVYITSTMAEEKGEPGIYANPETGNLEMYDPWGHPYYAIVCPDKTGCYDPFTGVRAPGKRCLVYSLGPDGKGEPDISGLARSIGKKKGGKFKPSASDDDDDNPMADNIYSWKNTK